jgi:hypothetical protein
MLIFLPGPRLPFKEDVERWKSLFRQGDEGLDERLVGAKKRQRVS